MTRPTRKATAGPIRGSVARIEDEHTLIINRGSEHNVMVGMIFGVLADGGDQIIDPETGDVIGELPTVKLRVRVSEVHPKYSRAETFVKYQPAPALPSLASFLPQDMRAGVRIGDVLGPDFHKSLHESGALESLQKAAARELSNPSPRRQQIAGAKTERPKEAPVRPEVTVNIGDRVEQEFPSP